MTLFYKNPEDVEASEEDPATVNVNEVCQHCGNEAGYTLVGKVGEATQEEMSDYAEEETVDVASTEEGEEEPADEASEEPSDEELDVELDELDLNLDLDAEEDTEEKAEESFHVASGQQALNEIFSLHEGVGSEIKQMVTSTMNKLAEEGSNNMAKTAADVLEALPNEAIDTIVDELNRKFNDFKLDAAGRKKIIDAAGGKIEVTEDTDTVGKVLNMLDSFELAKSSPELIKAIVVAIIAVIALLEPTPIVELIAAVVAILPAEVVANVMAVLNPTGAIVNSIYKATKEAKHESIKEDLNSLSEEAELEVSADEFEELINSPEFKKPISDAEARSMIDELDEAKNRYYEDDYLDSDDIMHYGKFLYAHWVKDTPDIKQLDKNTYKVTRQDGRASVIVNIDNTNKQDSTIKFTVNKKPFSTKSIKAAQEFILKELDTAFIKQFDVDLDESVKVNNEVLKYAVINPDGTYAGVPCTSEEEARELAAQKEGRVIVKLGTLIENLEEGAFDKLKDKLIGGTGGNLASRKDKANWVLANALEDYNKAKADKKGQLVPDENNQRFHTFVVVGYTDKYSNGKAITTAPSFNNKDLIVGKNGVQEKTKYEQADNIAKGWSMSQGNGPAFIYLAKSKDDTNAVFLCEYFKGELENDQLEKYFKVVKDHLKGAKLMAKGGMNNEDAQEATNGIVGNIEYEGKYLKDSLNELLDNTDELQEASLEKAISESLIEAYGNVAGFRLAECAYTDDKFTVDGTIYFTSGNKRKTTYTFTEALGLENGKASLRGINEKLGLDKHFIVTGYTDNKTFITESVNVHKK